MLNAYVINANSKRNKRPRRRTSLETAFHRAYSSFRGMLGRYEHSTINPNSESRNESHSSVASGSESSAGGDIHVIQGGQQIIYKVVEISARISPEAAGLDKLDVLESKDLLPNNLEIADTIASEQTITKDGENVCPL